jgi:hypothetical protein
MAKNDGTKITASERRRRAIELRREGLSYQVIADQLGMAKSSVHNTVGKAMSCLKESIAGETRVLVVMEMDRLDTMQAAIWGQAMDGHLGSIDRLLKIMDRRAKLLGLDAPAKVAPTTPDGKEAWSPDAMSAKERNARIAELHEKLGYGTLQKVL